MLERPLEEFTARGGRLRVITTTYLGATERRALDRLVQLGAEVKVCYETRTTRLHAKAWLLRRETGYWTAYVGSSNLSKSALLDGLEWNVRLSNVEQPHLLDTFAATFDEYWADPAFEEYRPDRDRPRLDAALDAERGGPADLPLDIVSPLEVRPWGYQQEVLDEPSAERQVHGRSRNLVVMATGTGKTVELRLWEALERGLLMARRFIAAGIPSRAVTARTGRQERARALTDLRDGQVRMLFTVDLFNEGVDLPEIDTVLLLRPTESAMIFLQQIGRGLRLADGKACLTVLDFVGAQHARFRFDLRYRALTGATRRGLVREVERGFPYLPAGCHIELDRVASRLVLDNVRRSLQVSWPDLAAELRRLGDCSLGEFLDETGLDAEDLYRRARGGWTDLRRRAGLDRSAAGPDDDRLSRAIGRMLHIDDPGRLDFPREVSGLPVPPRLAGLGERRRRLAAMLHFAVWGAAEPARDLEASLRRFWQHSGRRAELLDLARVVAAG